MNTLESTCTFNNEDILNDKASQIEFTREISSKDKFREWLNEAKRS